MRSTNSLCPSHDISRHDRPRLSPLNPKILNNFQNDLTDALLYVQNKYERFSWKNTSITYFSSYFSRIVSQNLKLNTDFKGFGRNFKIPLLKITESPELCKFIDLVNFTRSKLQNETILKFFIFLL